MSSFCKEFSRNIQKIELVDLCCKDSSPVPASCFFWKKRKQRKSKWSICGHIAWHNWRPMQLQKKSWCQADPQQRNPTRSLLFMSWANNGVECHFDRQNCIVEPQAKISDTLDPKITLKSPKSIYSSEDSMESIQNSIFTEPVKRCKLRHKSQTIIKNKTGVCSQENKTSATVLSQCCSDSTSTSKESEAVREAIKETFQIVSSTKGVKDAFEDLVPWSTWDERVFPLLGCKTGNVNNKYYKSGKKGKVNWPLLLNFISTNLSIDNSLKKFTYFCVFLNRGCFYY